MAKSGVVPPDLEDWPLGPELFALLDGLDPDAVGNEDAPRVLAAVSRAKSRWDALELGWVNEVSRRDPSAPPWECHRLARPHRFGADEARVACGWTRQRAEWKSAFADELLTLLPDVAAALYDGEIDLVKAQVCHTYLADLDAPERASVWAKVAEKAAGWNSGQLAARLRKLTLGVSPENAEQRYERAVAARRAVWFLNPDGTASLALDGVGPGGAAAAKKRITALARKLRRAGCPGMLDQLRADITLALLDGTLEGLTSEEIVTHFCSVTSTEPASRPPSARSTLAPSATFDPSPHDAHPGDNVTGPSAAESAATGPGAAGSAGARAGERGTAGTAGTGSRPGTGVVIELGTLIGIDRRPGELPELRGAVPARVAREEALAQRRGHWVVAVCDHEGYLLCCDTLRARPDGATDRYRGGVVELRLTVPQLEYWLHDPPARFEKLIAEIAARYRAWPQQAAGLNARPDQRFPHDALRRWIETRDQTCQGPGGCGRPARQSDKDHTHDVQHGGKTTDRNLSPQCDHDHLLKTEGGWTLHQPEPGVLIWRSPLGQVYRTRGDPLMDPLPELDPDPPF